MALPAPIDGTFTTTLLFSGKYATGEAGPWFYNHWVYGLMYDITNNTHEIWVSTNTTSGTTTYVRGELWAEADSGNNIQGATNTAISQVTRTASAYRLRDTLWMAYVDSSSNLEVSSFDLVSRTWGTTVTSTLGVTTINPVAHSFQGGNGIGITKIDDTNLRIVYGTFTGTLLNIYYTDFDISAGTFGTQSGPVNGTGSAFEYYNACVLSGENGRTHVFYEADQRAADGSANGTAFHRSISFDGTLATQQTIKDLGYNGDINGYDIGQSLYDFASGSYRLAIPTTYDKQDNGVRTWFNPTLLYGTSEADPTWSESIMSTGTVVPTADNENRLSLVFPCPDENPTTVWAVYPGVVLATYTTTGASNGDFDLFLAKSPYGTDAFSVSHYLDFGTVVGTGSPNFGETYNLRGPRMGKYGNTVGVFFTIGDGAAGPTWYTESTFAFEDECCNCPEGGGNYAYLS